MSNSYDDFNRRLIQDLRANGRKRSGGPFQGRDLLILTTRGARSGQARETPLVYTRDGDRIVIVASKGGAPQHPSWFHNLVAHPTVSVELLGERFEARAMIVDGEEEYERLYAQHAELNPSFHDYRRKTSRKIPVVVLERLEKSNAA